MPGVRPSLRSVFTPFAKSKHGAVMKFKGSGDRRLFLGWTISDELLELSVPWCSHVKIGLIVELPHRLAVGFYEIIYIHRLVDFHQLIGATVSM